MRTWTKLLSAAAVGVAAREVYRRTRSEDLAGQVALITGSSRGLGFLLARELAREGCPVVLCARDQRELEIAQQSLESEGAEVLALTCDLTDRAQVERMVAEATAHFGRIDILVNNAGIIQVGPMLTMTLEDYQNSMDIMYWGTMYTTLAVLPQMMERRSGHIVNITSIAARVSVPHLLPYDAAKYAAQGFSEALHAELARFGIKVTIILPGLMRTGSYLNVDVKGNRSVELMLFALSDNLPFISIDAEKAARQIVGATKRGETMKVLTVPANLAARFHGLFPGTTVELLGLVNRFLPSGVGQGQRGQWAMQVWEDVQSSVLRAVIGMGRSSAEKYNQFSGTPRSRRAEDRVERVSDEGGVESSE